MLARALVLILCGAPLILAIGCAIGPEQDPGCHVDAECGTGWTCRAGACFRDTTDRTNPSVDAGDAGDMGDASTD